MKINPLPLIRRHPWRCLAVASVLSLPLLAVGYWRWVESRTQDVFVGVSPERVRWAQMTDKQRDAATCMGAHGMKDALEGHAPDFCRPYLKQILAEAARLRLEAERNEQR